MRTYKCIPRGCTGGWVKDERPMVGRDTGMAYDMSILMENGGYRMWFSCPPGIIAHAESADGLTWSAPRTVLTRVADSPWCADMVSRPCVLKRDGIYRMWYCGHRAPGDDEAGSSCVGYAESTDGLRWNAYAEPVLRPELPWENRSFFCPFVRWDEDERLYKMWYSAGEQRDADAIGYATSFDGVHWSKYPGNPVLRPVHEHFWEMMKVECADVVKHEDGYYYLFYIGIDGDWHASVGLARSRDGITGWERHPDNPIIAPTDGGWDPICVYRPCVVRVSGGYWLYYNGAFYRDRDWTSYGVRSVTEEIGRAVHEGFMLWPAPDAPRERALPPYQGAVNRM